jgi:hypothetical protein
MLRRVIGNLDPERNGALAGGKGKFCEARMGGGAGHEEGKGESGDEETKHVSMLSQNRIAGMGVF